MSGVTTVQERSHRLRICQARVGVITDYILLQNKSGRSPPHSKRYFSGRTKVILTKYILLEVQFICRFILVIDILISRFYKRSSRNCQIWAMLYIVLKCVIWRIKICNLFREIFKNCENISNNRFHEIHKSLLKFAKFEYFAKQIFIISDHLL